MSSSSNPIDAYSWREVTSGALDDGFRHSITKFSDLHFTSSVAHRKRVIQLGEQPRKVFNVGPMVLDNFLNLKFLSKTALRKKKKNFKSKKRFHRLLSSRDNRK